MTKTRIKVIRLHNGNSKVLLRHLCGNDKCRSCGRRLASHDLECHITFYDATTMAFVGVGVGSVTRSLFPRSVARCTTRRPLSTMVISPGAALPMDKELMTLADGKPSGVKIADVFGGKKVVLFTIPGALTPTCTDSHAPEYVAKVADLKAKGVDDVVCLSVNGMLHLRCDVRS